MIGWILLVLFVILVIMIISSFAVIRPTQRGVVETFGKYSRYCEPGLNFIVPLVQRLIVVDITESMQRIEQQEMITEDKLNTLIDLVVFYKIKSDESNLKKALYNVQDVRGQIIMLAQTTGRNVIGGMLFKDVNAERNQLNKKLAEIMKKETETWGVEIVRVELKEIIPPKEVQETMNQVIQAENKKRAAIDFATAKETEADGIKRAAIKEAEGIAKGRVLVAQAKAEAIRLVNTAANRTFKGNAQKQRALEVAENSLKNNAKIVLGADSKNVLKLFDIQK